MDFHPDDQSFWDDPGEDPSERFPYFAVSIVLAVIVCGAIALWVV